MRAFIHARGLEGDHVPCVVGSASSVTVRVLGSRQERRDEQNDRQIIVH